MKKKPVLGITMGDPAGCGPELTIKALENKNIYEICNPIVVGDINMMEDAIRVVRAKDITLHKIADVKEAKFQYGVIDVYHLDLVDMSKHEYGKVSVMAGEAAFQCVKTVIELAMEKKIDVTVTNALNKEAINLAGHHYSGHTEIYAALTGTSNYSMMLAHDDLRVVHVSTHVSLREACDRVKKQRVYDVIKLAHDACKSLGIENPKVGVAGLNPHSGENGIFGTEEKNEIEPAIKMAQEEGLNVDGPVPPDTIFSKAQGGWYDIVVAMYHDQGHIPLKVVGFVYDKKAKKWASISGINVTLGLPIIRSSVDHGTAFEYAGQGHANEISLLNAIEYGVQLAINKK
ncbi:4-hydroxythreonine-4-phosphate dehydrogenase PdxA [Marinisporobacter balticus]|uniref:4-hydroxythreonine-4-phosphate dehydrogenase n=1 Tax=Marinisporobacter balticus TaxID=2018667 RepID=A0A4R2KZQ4_9FIRM|nr:4-hydroxythreonine-4-phosphate dehydrogenase PdxA [Marinisporobacter balticus]TCO76876.1 4-hydroxythreonine-4-phosphate dehydrogenase [Marinisporobacter balticus]